MTKNDETPRTVRDMPTPYAVCDSCGGMPALENPTGDGSDLCPKCTARRNLEEAAAAHLRDVLGETLGTWGDFWMRAGLSRKTLISLLETWEAVENPAELLANWQTRAERSAEGEA